MSQDPYWDWIQWHLNLSKVDQEQLEQVVRELVVESELDPQQEAE